MLALLSFIFLFGLMPITFSLPVPISQRDSSPKYVVAHFMVGNAYPYTVNDWLNDIKLASSSGIDGFALNIGSDSWQPARVQDAYTAAQQSGTNFKMFISFDMTALPCASPADASALQKYVNEYVSNPAQLMYNGKAVFSSFSGETCQFGTGSVTQGWSSVFGNANIVFIPSFFSDPSQFGTYGSIMGGALNWNGGWPIDLTTGVLPTSLTNGAQISAPSLVQWMTSMATDNKWLSGLGLSPTTQTPSNNNGKIYMAAASPWFFTHYGANSYNKNWVYICDDHLYAKRWENLVAKREYINIVELLTWNDYGESHYMGPIKGSQPNSQAWVDGFDHQGWLAMTSYYAQAFKTGTYATPTKDKVVLWARPHSKNSNSGDPVGKPLNWEIVSDSLWAWILLTDTATVTLSTSPSNSQTFTLTAGLHKLDIPLAPGGPLSAQVLRNGQQVLSVQSTNYTYTEGQVNTYNFNAYVIASP